MESTRFKNVCSGDRFGRLQVVAILPERENGYRVCKCVCSCGKTTIKRIFDLLSGRTKSCGCARWACRNLTVGCRHGRLVAVKEVGRSSSDNSRLWLFKCDCGREITRVGYQVANDRIRSCGCLAKENARHAKRSYSAKVDVPARIQYVKYKCACARKRRDFKLSFDQFRELVRQPCEYCGKFRPVSLSRTHRSVLISGVDRIDSHKGYSPENCVPCCKLCNTAKSTLTTAEFKEWLSDVHAHLKTALLRRSLSSS